MIYHLLRADFLERVRRYSFLVTLALTLVFAYFYIPDRGANWNTLALGQYRGVYNSAWVGMVMAMLTGVFLSLPVFYLVKNAIERDRETGVGQIIAASPVSKLTYVLGKWLSNWAYSSVMVAVVALGALGMQLLRGEDLHIDLWALWSPFVIGVLPGMGLVSSLAVLFESVRWLRGGFGNVVFCILWMFNLSFSNMLALQSGQVLHDPFGFTPVLMSVKQYVQAHFPDYTGGMVMGFNVGGSSRFVLFEWPGIVWPASALVARLLWLGAAVGLVLLAALCFNRFDEAPRRVAPRREQAGAEEAPASAAVTLSPLAAGAGGSRFWRLLWAELRLLLHGTGFWWYLVALSLLVAQVLVPLAVAVRWLLPLAWVWPLLRWSPMGSLELRHQTEGMVFASPGALYRQLPALWGAGFVLAAVMGLGVAARLVLTGDVAGVAAWLVGAAFIPSLALAAGVWTGSSKLFEVCYLLLWYVGALDQTAKPLNFAAASGEAWGTGMGVGYLAATVGLVVLAVWGRTRQMRQ